MRFRRAPNLAARSVIRESIASTEARKTGIISGSASTSTSMSPIEGMGSMFTDMEVNPSLLLFPTQRSALSVFMVTEFPAASISSPGCPMTASRSIAMSSAVSTRPSSRRGRNRPFSCRRRS